MGYIIFFSKVLILFIVLRTLRKGLIATLPLIHPEYFRIAKMVICFFD